MPIALLAAGSPAGLREAIERLAAGLRDRGYDAQVLAETSGVTRRVDELLALRGFAVPLAHIPLTLRRLRQGHFELTHAFSPSDAFCAQRWRTANGTPAAYTCTATLGRADVADRRLRMRLLTEALEASDAVLASSAEVRDSLACWFAKEASVIELDDVAAHAALYHELPGGRR